MLEPYVLKGTRTVPRRGEMSNHLFLFDKILKLTLLSENNSGIPILYRMVRRAIAF